MAMQARATYGESRSPVVVGEREREWKKKAKKKHVSEWTGEPERRLRYAE
jgi:hypothetical protein